jgi:hypothetical protein
LKPKSWKEIPNPAMDAALGFFRTYETYIYLILCGWALWEIRHFILSWDEVRGAAFGLERESAQSRLNRAAVMLVLILLMAISEFSLVYFVIPGVPAAMPLPTPTIDLLATPTTTLPAGTLQANDATPLATVLAPTPLGTTGCIPDQLEITAPKSGEMVSNTVTIVGSVDLPDLGFYKYEIARPGDTVWLTLQAGRGVKHHESLGDWNTASLPPGDYLLHLVATDNKGLDIGTCQIQVNVSAPPQ